MEYGPRYRQWHKVRTDFPFRKCMIGSPTDSERMWQFQHTGMAHKNAHTYRFVQELESSVLLRDLSKDPNNYSVSVKRCVK